MTQTQKLAIQVVKSNKVNEVNWYIESIKKPVSVQVQFDAMFKVK